MPLGSTIASGEIGCVVEAVLPWDDVRVSAEPSVKLERIAVGVPSIVSSTTSSSGTPFGS